MYKIDRILFPVFAHRFTYTYATFSSNQYQMQSINRRGMRGMLK